MVRAATSVCKRLVVAVAEAYEGRGLINFMRGSESAPNLLKWPTPLLADQKAANQA